MAKGLKVGDAVTVREEMRIPRKWEVYQQGLKRLKRGEVGHVVATADGRSVMVEFGGKQVKLASQRLERVAAPEAAATETSAKDGKSNGTPTKHTDSPLVDFDN